MEKPIAKTSPVIAKMAQLMMAIETRIQNDGPVYLPKHRSRFIDLTTMNLSELEDDYFTYDQIKQLVANMVQSYESNGVRWGIDLANCAEDKVAVVVGQHGHFELLPLKLFMAVTTSTPVPSH
jgi:hypothetical protein